MHRILIGRDQLRENFKFQSSPLSFDSISFQQRDHFQSTKDDRRKQIEMWGDLIDLFEVKKKCFLEAKQQGIGGTLSFTNTSETFTLQ